MTTDELIEILKKYPRCAVFFDVSTVTRDALDGCVEVTEYAVTTFDDGEQVLVLE